MEIKQIRVKIIEPHPNNPRKDLGDLKELTESIKTKGVLQNLTVVPSLNSGGAYYTVVIGHRRFAAAKAAGLNTVPCIVSHMSEKEQIETMLIENMQRNDLTTYEQAGGFQMMIDFGDTISDLSQSTGFSEQTIKHRLKIMELDAVAVKKAEAQQIKISDYISLEQIKDPKMRNNVLRNYGTNNFKWSLDNAIKEQRKEEGIKEIVEKLEKFAVKMKNDPGYGNGYKHLNCFYPDENKKIEEPKEEGEYFYYISPYVIYLYKKEEIDKKAEEEKAFKDAAIKAKAKVKEAEDLNRQTTKCIEDYLKICALPKNHIDIYKYIMRAMCNWNGLAADDACKFLKIKTDKDTLGDDKKALLAEAVEEQGLKILLIGAYLIEKANIKKGYITANEWNSRVVTYNFNPSLDRLYELLILLGYQMSDEEKLLKDGTHEIFNNG